MCEEQEEMLIILMEKYTILYDNTSKDYKNEVKKYNAWATIAEALSMSVTDVQAMWLRLRTRMAREIKKYVPSGAAGGEECTWVHFESMKFLKKFIKPRRTLTNIVCTPVADWNTTVIIDESDDSHTSIPNPPSPFIPSKTSTPVIPKPSSTSIHPNPPYLSSNHPIPLASTSQEPDPAFKRKRAKTDTLEGALEGSLKDFALLSKSFLSGGGKKSSNELFCLSLANMLDSMGTKKANRVKKTLFNICIDALNDEENSS